MDCVLLLGRERREGGEHGLTQDGHKGTGLGTRLGYFATAKYPNAVSPTLVEPEPDNNVLLDIMQETYGPMIHHYWS